MHESGNIVSLEHRLKVMALAVRHFYHTMGGRPHQKLDAKKARSEAKRFKRIAQHLRTAKEYIKILQPTYEGIYGQKETAKEIDQYVEMLEMTAVRGPRIEIYRVFAISLFMAGALGLYRNFKVKPDWELIGCTIREAFGLPTDDGNSEEWAKLTFKRYRRLLGRGDVHYKAMRDGIARKLLDVRRDEQIMMPRAYLEKISRN